MFTWLQEQWTIFTQWIEALQPRTAAILGATATAVIAVLWQSVLFPLLRVIGKGVMARLYPLLSGALILDRVWSLPKYLKALRVRVSHLSNPWLDEAQKLTEIFVPVSATTDVGQTERIELSTLFRTHRTFVVIGEPGSGKTTGLKSIAIACLNKTLVGASGQSLVPVFIPLRQLAQSKHPLEDFVVAEFYALGFPHARRLLRRLEQKGRLVFLLDGLDEVDESDRPQIISKLIDLLERQHRNDKSCHVVVTSRPVGYDEQLRGYVAATVRMADFNLAEIRKFVDNWDFRPPKSRERLLSAIADRRPIFEICKNPLMLTIVTSLYRDYDYTLPDSREEFYRVCIEALLRKWDEAKNMEDRNTIKASYKAAFLEEFAFTAIEQAFLDFRETYLISQIEVFLERRQYKQIDATRFLAELLRSGLLSRLATGEIFFAHKTLAESLAALHLRNQSGRLVELWKQKPESWLEVCSLFVADPKTSERDIIGLLDAAKESGNWNHLLVFAGEAHFCPEPNRTWIVETIGDRSQIWRSLDLRAVAALTQLSHETPELLASMAHAPDAEVRTKAIHALGTLSDDWAVNILSDLLVQGVDSEATANALAGMGSDGIAVVMRVIDRDRSNVTAMSSCLNILEQLGTLQAVETAVPLLWDGQNGEFAALTCARLLSDSGLRAMFETVDGGTCPSTWREHTEKIAEWAVPEMDDPTKTRQRSLYGRMIEMLARWMVTAEWEDIEELLKQAPSFLVIPAAILAMPLRDEFLVQYFAIRQKEKNVGELPLVRSVVSALDQRPILANQKLWTKSTVGVAEIQITDETRVRLLVIVFAMIFLIPLGYGIYTGAVSPWWIMPVVPSLIFAARIFSEQKEPTLFLVGFGVCTLGIGVLLPHVFRQPGWLRRQISREPVMTWAIIIGGIANAVAAGYTIWILGRRWWWCVVPLVVTAIFYDVVNERFALPRRSNPISDLRARLEKRFMLIE